MIRGIKREHAEPERRERSPLTRDCLLRILRLLQQPTYKNHTFKAAFTLAFAGFLRVGEFTYHLADLDIGAGFRNWFLTKSSIRISEDSSFMAVNLPASKTDPFRQGVEIIIATSKDKACPVEAMRTFLHVDRHRPPFDPLFTADQFCRLSFTREHLVHNLCTLATSAGLGAGSWNGHRFRRGATTRAAEVGLPEQQIQALGRWTSATYRSYIQASRDDRIAMSRRFQQPQLRRLPYTGSAAA